METTTLTGYRSIRVWCSCCCSSSSRVRHGTAIASNPPEDQHPTGVKTLFYYFFPPYLSFCGGWRAEVQHPRDDLEFKPPDSPSPYWSAPERGSWRKKTVALRLRWRHAARVELHGSCRTVSTVSHQEMCTIKVWNKWNIDKITFERIRKGRKYFRSFLNTEIISKYFILHLVVHIQLCKIVCRTKVSVRESRNNSISFMHLMSNCQNIIWKKKAHVCVYILHF